MKCDNVLCLPEGTKCFDCVYKISRVIEPLDYSDYEEFEIEEGDTIIQHACMLMDIDIHNHVVHECTKYEKEKPGLFIENRFL